MKAMCAHVIMSSWPNPCLRPWQHTNVSPRIFWLIKHLKSAELVDISFWAEFLNVLRILEWNLNAMQRMILWQRWALNQRPRLKSCSFELSLCEKKLQVGDTGIWRYGWILSGICMQTWFAAIWCLSHLTDRVQAWLWNWTAVILVKEWK